MTNAEARFNNSLRPRKPEGSLGRTAQDVHLDSHTAPELCVCVSPFDITRVKGAHKARTFWCRQPFHLMYRCHIKEKYKKGMDRSNEKSCKVV